MSDIHPALSVSMFGAVRIAGGRPTGASFLYTLIILSQFYSSGSVPEATHGKVFNSLGRREPFGTPFRGFGVGPFDNH
jgi:hypothetical protein